VRNRQVPCESVAQNSDTGSDYVSSAGITSERAFGHQRAEEVVGRGHGDAEDPSGFGGCEALSRIGD
jgi:hypothetical protein